MQVIRRISRIKKQIQLWKKQNYQIGFVPTMGALHQGHLSLINQATKENDKVVVSIFVNPLQFGPREDFKQYPRPFREDVNLCQKAGVDVVFYPTIKEMYPEGFKTFVDMHDLPEVLCGRSRPGHFRGVMTVVIKLFNIIEPHIAYFGQKDYQQALIIKQMVKDLNIPIDIKLLPIVREKDGLAMSSRNKYLSEKERKEAVCLYESLVKAQELIRKGENSPAKIIMAMRQIIKTRKSARIDYIVIVDPLTLKNLTRLKPGQPVLIALAVYIGKTRLIDNFILNCPS